MAGIGRNAGVAWHAIGGDGRRIGSSVGGIASARFRAQSIAERRVYAGGVRPRWDNSTVGLAEEARVDPAAVGESHTNQQQRQHRLAHPPAVHAFPAIHRAISKQQEDDAPAP